MVAVCQLLLVPTCSRKGYIFALAAAEVISLVMIMQLGQGASYTVYAIVLWLQKMISVHLLFVHG